MNHLAFHVPSPAKLDRLVVEAPEHGWRLLPERHHEAGFEVEFVVEG
ncbi:hypothetical protein [Streptomyces sp. NPDC051218]